MNKKLITGLSVCAGLLAVLVVVLLVLMPEVKQPGSQPPGSTGSQISANNPSEPGLRDDPSATDPSRESQENLAESTEVTLPTDVTDPTGIPDTTTEPGEPTIPPENVEMGTEQDKDASGSLEDENFGNVSTTPTQGKDPEQTTPPTTNPGGSILGDNFDITKLTYEEFMAMTGEQQRAVVDLFGSPEDFMTWFKAVEAIYKAEHPDIEIGGDGNVDMGG